MQALSLVACFASTAFGLRSDSPADPIIPVSIAEQAYLKASNTGAGDRFGEAVAISGDTLVIGAPFESSAASGINGNGNDDSLTQSGAVYVFVRRGTLWQQQAYLKASNPGAHDWFGTSVAIDGNTLVVGAEGESSNATGVNGNQQSDSAHQSGAAYVFVRHGETWKQQAYLKASNTGAWDRFGQSIGISGETIVVGALEESSSATTIDGNANDDSAPAAGAAYVFVRSGNTWAQQAYLKASNADADDWFTKSLAIDGDTIVVGADGEDSAAHGVNGDASDDSAPWSGAAYVFVRSGTTWSEQAYLKAANSDPNDYFGVTCSISGDTIAIGALWEDSSAAGVNGDAQDDSMESAGAAYVFVRNGSTWTQQAYLKASNPDGGDRFGTFVAVSGDELVATAHWEDSGSAGVNGNQLDESLTWSGAAYAFHRSGATWVQTAYIKASNPDAYDKFGKVAALDGKTLVLGAEDEDSATTGVDGDALSNTATASGAGYVFDLAAWIDHGHAYPGVDGDPKFRGTGLLTPSTVVAFDLVAARPNALAALFLSTTANAIPFFGGSLVPYPIAVPPILVMTTAQGTVPMSTVLPEAIPSTIDLWLQFAVVDPAAVQGVALSNAIRSAVP